MLKIGWSCSSGSTIASKYLVSPRVRLFTDGPDRTFSAQPAMFGAIAGELRLSTKYDIPLLREWAVNELLLSWPQELEYMNTTAFPHAAGSRIFSESLEIPSALIETSEAITLAANATYQKSSRQRFTRYPSNDGAWGQRADGLI